MKILQLIQKPQLRGAEIFACQLSNELVHRNADVDIVYLFEHHPFELAFDLNFINLKANSNRRLWDWRAYKRLGDIVTKGRYNIVQANAADTLKYAVMSKLLFGWKARIVFRNASLMGRLMHSPFQKVYNRLLLDHCDGIVSVSENCRQDLVKFYPKASTKSVTIPIGTYLLDESEVPTHPRGKEVPVFLHVGSFVWEKNHELLINIFQKYLQQQGDGCLWLVGDGKLRQPIEGKVSALGLENKVVFWGVRKDVASLLKSADILLFPSVVEGVPGVILEALSVGTPVIASNVGGIPEIITNGVNGYCLSSFNDEDYVKSMHRLATDPGLRSRLIQNGKDTIRKSYDMKEIAARFAGYYQSVLKQE